MRKAEELALVVGLAYMSTELPGKQSYESPRGCGQCLQLLLWLSLKIQTNIYKLQVILMSYSHSS